ncbi:MAG: glycerol-3-phosphate 1-O-acyltransferase PlsY [Alcaligenaceae bacterium]|jgi:acyl phosphate:glycerol-3-phosphate acyltransferase|nr:glycerol-3-phosphate 1-O-acyltransferase PlsY [Alcaligenaceae bacterium]
MTPFFATALGLLIIATAYLLGSIPFAVVVSRSMGLQDPRTFGSKNPGATNVLRSGNKTAALLTLVGDALKGLVAVWLAQWLATLLGLGIWVVAAAAVAVFLGHVYPVFLGFKGGKGVATALGVLLALQPLLALATVATWLIVAYASKYSSLAAIMAAVFAPLYYLFGGNIGWRLEPVVAFAIILISVMLCFRHGANITRLMKGTEPRIGAGKKNHEKTAKKP